MPVGRTKAGMAKHFDQILRVWGGKEATHVKITETIDDMGNIIDQSRDETTIYGVISPADFKGSSYPVGYLQPGDLTGLFKAEDDVIVSNQITESTTRHDNIIYEDFEYRVDKVEYAYDIRTSQVNHEAVFGNYLLRRVTI